MYRRLKDLKIKIGENVKVIEYVYALSHCNIDYNGNLNSYYKEKEADLYVSFGYPLPFCCGRDEISGP